MEVSLAAASAQPRAESVNAPDIIHNSRRLIITKMVLENFKSYAGVCEIGPLHKRFSAVVGPNGSGKSNIIDAMLFVFGKRASQLRHKKVSELIHSSDTFPDLQEARVSVHFQTIIDQEGEDYEVVPNTEIVLTRTATRKDQSKYYMNGRTCTWGEATDLVKKAGIDLDNNRFLILQGEVEQIALMKPKAANANETGLLEYLEDIIGTLEFVPKIEEASKVVEQLNEQRTEHANRARAVEKEKEGLQGAKEEAEQFISLELQVCEKHSVQYQHQVMVNKRKAEQKLKLKEELEAKVKAERERVSTLHQSLSGAEGNFKRLTKEKDEIQTEMEKVKKDYTEFERKVVKFTADQKHLRTKEKKLTEAIENAKKKGLESEGALKSAKENLVELQKDEKKAQVKLTKDEKALDEILASLKGVTADLHVQLEAKQKEFMPFSKEITEYENQVKIANSESELITKRVATAKVQYTSAKEALETASKSLAAKTEDLKVVQAKLKDAKEKQPELEKQVQHITARDVKATDELRMVRQRTEEGRASQSASKSKNQLNAALLDAKKSKKLHGIHGRLGDLGSIDGKYDVAISTACPQLDNIVVDTTDNAQKAVSFLRNNNLGTATFIILEKQTHLAKEATKGIEVPAGSHRLFDLVKPAKEEYTAVFYFALRDTLVADNLDAASKIAFGGQKRYRVVSLDGKLIDASGTMSGGGNRVARGGMGSNAVSEDGVSTKDIKELESNLASKSEEVQAIRIEKNELVAAQEALKAELFRLEGEKKKLELDVPSLSAQKSDVEKQLPALKAACASSPADEARLTELKSAIAESEAKLTKANKAASSLQAALTAIQNDIDNVGGGSLKSQKLKVQKSTSALDEIASSQTKTNVLITTTEKNITKAAKAIEASQEELAKVMQEHRQMSDDLESLAVDAEKVNELHEAAQARLTEKTDELKSIHKAYEKQKKEMASLKSAEVDLVNQLEDLIRSAKEAHHAEQSSAKKLAELEKIHTRIVGEDENASQGSQGSDAAPAAERGLQKFSEEELQEVDVATLQAEVEALEQARNSMKPNMGAIAEYRKKEAEFQSRQKELDAVTAQRDEARRVFEDLRKQRLTQFMAGFSHVTMKLKEMYQMITLGGDAELELVDSLDPFSEGIVFSVRPPKKNWKNIQNLSGGEKTLSSLALVFALHHYKPTPLYVMDEIDAALDFKNVSIVANYIKERTKNAQFIIVSLRNNMFEVSDRMVGVYKTKNCSKSVTMNPHSFSISVA